MKPIPTSSSNFKVNLIALQTIAYKETNRILRIWIQTLVPPMITMSLYFFIFGRLIGDRIGMFHEYRYIDFIVPGLVMMSVITNAYANVVSSFFGAKFMKNINEIMVAPILPSIIILGFVCGGIIRGLLVGFIVLLVALFFTQLQIHSIGVILFFSVFAAVIFSLAGFINALFAKRFDDISIVPTFILTPLSYLGGVFYSIEMLSSPWKELSMFNPILYLVNGFRYGFIGYTDVPLHYSFLVLCFIALLLYSVCYYFIWRGYGLRS